MPRARRSAGRFAFQTLCAVAGATAGRASPDPRRLPRAGRLLSHALRAGADRRRDVIDISHEALIRCWRKINDKPDGWLQKEIRDGLRWRTMLFQARELSPTTDPSILSESAAELGRGLAHRSATGLDRTLRRRMAEGRGDDPGKSRALEEGGGREGEPPGKGKLRRLAKPSPTRRARLRLSRASPRARACPLDGVRLALAAWPKGGGKSGRPMLAETIRSLALSFEQHPPVAVMRHEGPVNGALFDQDGRRILSWSRDNTLRLWDAATGAAIGAPMRHENSVNGALFGKDERRILSWSEDNTLRLWDAATGAPIGAPMRHEIRSMARCSARTSGASCRGPRTTRSGFGTRRRARRSARR